MYLSEFYKHKHTHTLSSSCFIPIRFLHCDTRKSCGPSLQCSSCVCVCVCVCPRELLCFNVCVHERQPQLPESLRRGRNQFGHTRGRGREMSCSFFYSSTWKCLLRMPGWPKKMIHRLEHKIDYRSCLCDVNNERNIGTSLPKRIFGEWRH